MWLLLDRVWSRNEGIVGAGVGAAFSRGKRPLSHYDARCLVEESARPAKVEGDLARLEGMMAKGNPWTS